MAKTQTEIEIITSGSPNPTVKPLIFRSQPSSHSLKTLDSSISGSESVSSLDMSALTISQVSELNTHSFDAHKPHIAQLEKKLNETVDDKVKSKLHYKLGKMLAMQKTANEREAGENQDRALQHFFKSAESLYPGANTKLGQLLCQYAAKESKAKNDFERKRALENDNQNKDANSFYNHSKIRTLARNDCLKIAFVHFALDASLGTKDAYYHIARAFRKGEGVEKLPAYDRLFLRLTAALGSHDAFYEFASSYYLEKSSEIYNQAKGKDIMQALAFLGHAKAQTFIGDQIFNENKEQNKEHLSLAEKWWKYAAEAGEKEAIKRLTQYKLSKNFLSDDEKNDIEIQHILYLTRKKIDRSPNALSVNNLDIVKEDKLDFSGVFYTLYVFVEGIYETHKDYFCEAFVQVIKKIYFVKAESSKQFFDCVNFEEVPLKKMGIVEKHYNNVSKFKPSKDFKITIEHAKTLAAAGVPRGFHYLSELCTQTHTSMDERKMSREYMLAEQYLRTQRNGAPKAKKIQSPKNKKKH